MSEAKVRGIVHLVDETKTYGQKGFRKRMIVLEQENDRFTNYVPLEFTGDACDRGDELSVGDDVEFNYRLSGRKWQKDAQSEVKYFLNAEATDFEVLGKQDAGTAPSANDAFAEAAGDEEVPF